MKALVACLATTTLLSTFNVDTMQVSDDEQWFAQKVLIHQIHLKVASQGHQIKLIDTTFDQLILSKI